MPLLPADNAATRAHCVRIARALVRTDVDARVLFPSGVRSGRLRSGCLLARGLYWYGLVLPRRLVHLIRCVRCDVVVVQRGAFRYCSPPWFERLLNASGARRPRVVLHIDDALHDVAQRRRRKMVPYDRVVTGNSALASYYGERGATVELIPGALAVDRYEQHIHVADGRDVVLGWMGTLPERYLPLVVNTLARVCRRTGARVCVVSDHEVVLPALTGYAIQRRWRIEEEYSLPASFDIGLMPLHDDPYDCAKEGYKIKEYMAAGIPVVCSPVGHNRELVQDGINGYLVRSSQEWEDRLVVLVRDPELRARMGEAGRRLVRRFDVPAVAPAWLDLLQNLVSRRVC